MINYVIVPQPDYIGELLRAAPRFAASHEFHSLSAEDRACTGLVFAAFSRFCEASIADRQAADECSNALEHFASMNDSEAHNYIITEVYEGFHHPELSVCLLLPLSRALYDRWIIGY
jgi:hypothetical protein